MPHAGLLQQQRRVVVLRMGRKRCCKDICVFFVGLATQTPSSSRHTHQAGPLPPQGWRLNSKTCVHCPLTVPTRIHKKSIGTQIGAVMRSRALRWNVLYAVYVSCIWCAASGKSVCAASHLLHVLPCCVAAAYATPAVSPPKGKPKRSCLPSVAKRCIEGHEKTN